MTDVREPDGVGRPLAGLFLLLFLLQEPRRWRTVAELSGELGIDPALVVAHLSAWRRRRWLTGQRRPTPATGCERLHVRPAESNLAACREEARERLMSLGRLLVEGSGISVSVALGE
ncbi:hypothetical protein F0L68_37950 [Solihabitans fulvus]|uniref:Uncharacterized protein n=1 Tax=Solihabitans fulvus TaxID=1892852 RepID=A0A5B2WKC6_9PSEU|nr:hypothetical protein [Solihabitans fulvus]KAA2251210.1 hypothetical protein F0L68_37950 [Solihabitans fulvus]